MATSSILTTSNKKLSKSLAGYGGTGYGDGYSSYDGGYRGSYGDYGNRGCLAVTRSFGNFHRTVARPSR